MLKQVDKLFVKASSLEYNVPKFDYHIHANFADGEASIKESVLRAIEIGLERIIFTEHSEPWLMKNPDWFSKYCTEIEKEQLAFDKEIEILIGIEAPAIDLQGGLSLDNVLLSKCDYVLGAAHRYPGLKEGERVKDLNTDRAVELEYETLMALAENTNIHAIAHIGATCMKYVNAFPEDMIRSVIKKATKNNIAIEINDRYHQPLNNFINICKEEDAWVVLGSNAHNIKEIGSVYNSLTSIYK